MTVAVKTDTERAKEVNDNIARIVKDFQATFKCQRCGKCCKEGVGVALWPHEFYRLTKRIPKPVYSHIVMIGNWHALKLPCVFYKKKKCRIYDNRPIACRMYPLGVSPDGKSRLSANCTSIKLTTSKEV